MECLHGNIKTNTCVYLSVYLCKLKAFFLLAKNMHMMPNVTFLLKWYPLRKNASLNNYITLHDIFMFFSSKLGVLGGHWDISRRNHSFFFFLHQTITTLGHCCSMWPLGSSPLGQGANRTKHLWWPKKKKASPSPYWNAPVAMWTNIQGVSVASAGCLYVL